MECDPNLEARTGLTMDDALLVPDRDGTAKVVVTNPTSLLQMIKEDTELGAATAAIDPDIVSPIAPDLDEQ